MATVFSFGSWVFMPDADDMYVPAKVEEAFEMGKPGKVSRNGHQVALTAQESKECIRMDEQSNTSVPNLVELKELNEASILHALRLRFKQDEIYTVVGTILVSVNPFKLLPIYTGEVLETYKQRGSRDSPPHVYGIADNAYKAMVADNKNQSCIVSGESGAGKTEATKIFLQYIAEISGSANKHQGSSGEGDGGKKDTFGSASLQEQILKANPLMEAFGNAKTKRNNNSSRFGKWIEVKFNSSVGNIVGGSITQYLLEKSRLVSQAEGERNYHIFYQLCAGASMDPAVKQKFQITEPEDYFYLSASAGGKFQVDGINDERDWEDINGAMEIIGMTTQEQDDLLLTVAAVLHLGNVRFKAGGGEFQEGSQVENMEMVEIAAQQLGQKPEVLLKSLTSKQMKSGREIISKVNNVDAANASRDALAKDVYSKCFDWLIGRINVSLAGGKDLKPKKSDASSSFIGVLDIFGFETFDWNSFEQLCINYCNEKLQYHFNNHIFSLEQTEYRNEGIDVTQIVFADNQPTLDMLEAKKTGVFAIVDEEMVVPKGSDETLLVKLTKQHEKHANFRKPGVKTNYERGSFTVIHYAGAVMYNTLGFLEKNKDKISEDLESVVNSSESKFMLALYPGGGSGRATQGGATMGGNSNQSIGLKFKTQLAALMTTLNATDPHFIRCIKPNDEKQGNIFTSRMVIEQLRYAGLLEVCRIRQIGYPVRKDFKEFFRRYRCCVKPTKDVSELCKQMEVDKLMAKGDWQMGKNKVFMRNTPFNNLEAAREHALRGQAILLQKIARRFIERCRYLRMKAVLSAVRAAMTKRELQALKKALEDCGDFPNQGKHIQVVKDGTKLLHRLEEEQRVTKLLQDALQKNDYNLLTSAVSSAKDMQFASEDVTKAEQAIKKIEEERAAIAQLSRAIDTRELAGLVAAMDKIKQMGLTSAAEWQQAESLKKRLEEEQRMIEQLEKATAARDIDQLNTALNAAATLGFAHSSVEAAEKCKKDIFDELAKTDAAKANQMQNAEKEKLSQIEAERQKKVDELQDQLRAAAALDDEAQMAEAKRKVLEAGVGGAEVEALLGQAKKLGQQNELEASLKACIEAAESKLQSSNGITESDIARLSSAIVAGREGGLTNADSPEYAQAVGLETKMKRQIEAQKGLLQALEGDDFETLVRAMGIAQDLDMRTDSLQQVIDKVKEKDSGRVNTNGPRVETDLDEDEFERRRKENLAAASHERYAFHRYYKIRSDGDYVKTTMFNKRKVAECKLSYQKTPIPRSILELNKDLNKVAIGIHKSILGYSGEQLMSFPATLAQDILIRGLETPELVDEVYIQLMKHLTNNPKPESVGRAWQLMCMAVGTFPPSTDFEYYCINFLVEHLSVPGLVGNYAKYSLRRLEGMLIRGASGFVPNIDEILAYKERPPILATIELVDGTALTEDLPITPDLNVEKVLEICSHFLSLQDPRGKYFGIFVRDSEDESLPGQDFGAASAYSAARPDEGGAGAGFTATDGQTGETLPQMPPRTARPLRDKDFLGDVIVLMTRQRRKVSFVFKRKMFLPGEKPESDDPVYSRLMYLQCADEVISGNIPVLKENDVVDLAAIAVAADSEKFPSTEQALLDADLMEYIPAPWRNKKTDTNWARAVLAARGKVASKSLDFLQKKYVEMTSGLPLYGVTFFYVRRAAEDNDMICGIDNVGISFLSLSRVLLQSFPFKDVHRWGGSSSQFWLLVWDSKKNAKSKLSLYTSQARDMSALILDYALLAAETTNKKQ
ncbi:hypothetical protein BASA81_008561 [Batrachochytrium salamandrivorans]|nr:hypothetical protein BASA81_008561 [Batrachochytrium salamandrivorans]